MGRATAISLQTIQPTADDCCRALFSRDGQWIVAQERISSNNPIGRPPEGGTVPKKQYLLTRYIEDRQAPRDGGRIAPVVFAVIPAYHTGAIPWSDGGSLFEKFEGKV